MSNFVIHYFLSNNYNEAHLDILFLYVNDLVNDLTRARITRPYDATSSYEIYPAFFNISRAFASFASLIITTGPVQPIPDSA